MPAIAGDPTLTTMPVVNMEQNSRLVDVWVDSDNILINQNETSSLPFLSHDLVSETLAPLEPCMTETQKFDCINVGQAGRKVERITTKSHEKGVQVDQYEDELIRLLRHAKQAEQVKEWEFIEYSVQELANWQGDYQAQIWAVDRCIMGVTDDPSFHTFKMPCVKVPLAPMSVRDALRDRILNNGKNLPENALLSDMREWALGQGCLRTFTHGLRGQHSTPRGVPPT